jgi:hypothetical protein
MTMKTALLTVLIVVVILGALGYAGWEIFWQMNALPPDQPAVQETPQNPPLPQGIVDPTLQGTATLAPGGTMTAGPVTLTFLRVVQDNRCPVDVKCIQAGALTAEININLDGKTTTGQLSSYNSVYVYDGYDVTITKIAPDRQSNQSIKDGDYQITFSVTQDIKG